VESGGIEINLLPEGGGWKYGRSGIDCALHNCQ